MINSFLDFIQIIESGTQERTNKFNIHWQIVRTNAKSIKDPTTKIKYVLDFLEAHPSAANFDRVLNWVKMTGVAYKDQVRKQFETETTALINHRAAYDEEDQDNDLTKISTEDLKKVHKDLSKRKYGFQFKSVPKDHIEFMDALETELEKRKQSR